jgi:hypothetical protein
LIVFFSSSISPWTSAVIAVRDRADHTLHLARWANQVLDQAVDRLDALEPSLRGTSQRNAL